MIDYCAFSIIQNLFFEDFKNNNHETQENGKRKGYPNYKEIAYLLFSFIFPRINIVDLAFLKFPQNKHEDKTRAIFKTKKTANAL